MKRRVEHGPSLGITGLLTAMIVWLLETIFPAQVARPVAVLAGGALGAAASSELLFVLVTWRLHRERAEMARLLVAYEALHEEFERRIGERQRLMRERDASRRVMAGLQSELDQLREQYTLLLRRMRDRLSRITDQISG